MASTSGEVYVHDGNRTFAYFDVATNSVTRTGTLDRRLTDVAFAPDGSFFGIDFQSLYRVDPNTGATSLLRRLPVSDANGLVARDSDTLVITTLGGRWIEINTETGVTEFTTNLPNNVSSSGDVTAYVSETSRRTWIVSGAGSIFARWDYDSLGVGTGSTQRHALPDFWGLVSVGGGKNLIGGAGYQLYAVDADSGVGHPIADLRGAGFREIWGASWVYSPPATTTFEPLQYIASYPDLIAAFGANAAAGLNHYVAAGRNEGRTITFRGLDYIASYGDLIAAFGANAAAGAAHYIVAGRNEGRTISFNALNYIASYGDLIAAFSADADAGATHYTLAGQNEGRTASFDPVQYLANYADLRKNFGSDLRLATQHYILNGFREGRTDDTPLRKFNTEDVGGMYAEMALMAHRAYDRRVPNEGEQSILSAIDRETLENLFGTQQQVGSKVMNRWTPLNSSRLGRPDLYLPNVAGTPTKAGLYDYGMFVNNNAAAFLAEAEVNGKRTLAIAFRGTDNPADILDYNFAPHYEKFQELITSLDAYIKEHQVKQVFVTGHSLGGAMVQFYMHTHENGKAGAAGGAEVSYFGATFGSPGAQVLGPRDSRLVQFKNASDPVPHGGSLVLARESGRTINIVGPATQVPGVSGPHSMALYASEVMRLSRAGSMFLSHVPTDVPKDISNDLDVSLGAHTAERDFLEGTIGKTYLVGGFGNDVYKVHNSDDIILELKGTDQGQADEAWVFIDGYALPENVENLTLFTAPFSADIDATGNALGNVITGNDGNNALRGLDGIDSLDGKGEADTLVGGLGRDNLTGGGGGDKFYYDSPADGAAGTGDTIWDFGGDDEIVVYSPNFGPLAGMSGTLPLENFVAGTSTTLPTNRILKPNAFFSYNTTSRRLFFDTDGAGNAATPVALATINFLKSGDSLSNKDIVLTATSLG